MKAPNPYRWNQIDTNLFYGRQSFVEDLILDVLDGQSYAVMGGKRMGKTTLLRKIEEEVVSRFSSLMDGGLVVIPVYLDTLSIEELRSSDVISRKILETVIQFIDHQGLKAECTGHAASSKYSILNPFARDLFNLIEAISNHRVQIVILFDEISPIVYAEWGSTYLGNWRALLHNTPPLSNHVSAVFAGACEIVKLAVDVSSPLANILSWRFLHSFSCEDTKLLVHEPTNYCLPNDFHTRVFEATGGHPFLTQYLMFYVVASCASDPYRALDDACQHFLDYEHRQFQNWYSDFDKVTRQIYQTILEEGVIKKRELVRSFEDIRVQSQVQSGLDILCSYGVVRQIDRQTYSWSGEMFKDWFLDNCGGAGEVAPHLGRDRVVDQAFWEHWDSRLADLGKYNILVEGLTDRVYLELAAERYRETSAIDLLEGGAIRLVAGRGTKKMAPDFGVLQSLEARGVRFVVILDGDDAGQKAAEAMSGFGAQKNRHFFQLSREDYRDKGGKSWDVEIEDMLPYPLIESFLQQYPDAVEARLERRGVVKFVINGQPVEKDGQIYDYKMMLTEHVRENATLDELLSLIEILKKARKCMGL